MKTRKSVCQYKTPKELAIAILKPYVLRGDTVEDLVKSHMGGCHTDYSYQIGGYLVHDHGYPYEQHAKWTTKKMPRDVFFVEEFNGKEIEASWRVKDLVKEILATNEQLSLFQF